MEVIAMAANKSSVFGAKFLPGKDPNDHNGATRAMERNYGGQVGNPFNSADRVWHDEFTSSKNSAHKD